MLCAKWQKSTNNVFNICNILTNKKFYYKIKKENKILVEENRDLHIENQELKHKLDILKKKNKNRLN